MNDLDRQRSLNMLYAAPRTLRHQLETVETMTSVRIGDAIFQCLSEAESDTDEVQQQALQTLASVTKVSPQNRNLVAQTDGAISTLINLSKSSSPNVQFLSLSILFNLSLNPNLKQSLADMETISHLNSMILSSASLELSKLATSLICSLAMLDKNKAKFGVAGTIETLVEAVSGPRCPASHYLLSSLAELVQFHGNCTLAVRSGAVEVLLQIVENCEGEDLAGTSLAILCLLARFEEGLTALRKTPQVVSSMLEVLQGRCSFSKEGAAEILIRLFDESDECVRDALSLPEFTSVLADLSVRGSVRAREKAVLLMKKMVRVDYDSHGDGNTLLLQW
ncbi:uncharacterized protein LOC127812834 [Diospyros lotus]|uniref:uncharacterized protein LOC127812834 n=1 Tax=Diospyros lotus TaxID=55363 RepID=UPI0022535D40|nr:uncharacterized protein LOC127812834 [Diospyros lotus]